MITAKKNTKEDIGTPTRKWLSPSFAISSLAHLCWYPCGIQVGRIFLKSVKNVIFTLKYTSFSAYQINVRHTLLTKLIGTKTEEDESHDSVNRWVLVSSLSMLAFSLLEMVAYYLYNLKVSVVTYSLQYDVKIVYSFFSTILGLVLWKRQRYKKN